MVLRLFSHAAAGLARVGRLAIIVFFKQKAFQESSKINPNGTLQLNFGLPYPVEILMSRGVLY